MLCYNVKARRRKDGIVVHGVGAQESPINYTSPSMGQHWNWLRVGPQSQADGDQNIVFINGEIVGNNDLVWKPKGFAYSLRPPDSHSEKKFVSIKDTFANSSNWHWSVEVKAERNQIFFNGRLSVDLFYPPEKHGHTVTTNQFTQLSMWRGVMEGQGARCVTLIDLRPHRNLKPGERRFLVTLSFVFLTEHLITVKIWLDVTHCPLEKMPK